MHTSVGVLGGRKDKLFNRFGVIPSSTVGFVVLATKADDLNDQCKSFLVFQRGFITTWDYGMRGVYQLARYEHIAFNGSNKSLRRLI
jgi:hypothetical protein